MKTFFATLLAAVATAELMTPLDYEFMRYVSQHNKMYQTVEQFEMRKELFSATNDFVQEANSADNLYTAGHNQFSDYTEKEMNNILGLKDMPMPEVNMEALNDESVSANVPESWDWRTQGAVTPVKNQGSCGSCWAFSSVEAIESAWIIAGNEEEIMSTQELVDCSSSTGNEGCGGGWYFWAYDWLKTNLIMRESDYPYTSGNTG